MMSFACSARRAQAALARTSYLRALAQHVVLPRHPPAIASATTLGQRAYGTFDVMAKYERLPTSLPEGATLKFPHRQRAVVLPPNVRAKDHRSQPGMCIAIIGASGNSGRQIANALVAARPKFSGLGKLTMQFLGDRQDSSLGTLIGLCSELRDAFDDACPDFEVVCDIEVMEADIIIMAGGASMSPQYKTFTELARANMDIFDIHARQLKEKNSNSIVVIVSNPCEFAVDTFVKEGFSPERVLGFGAYLDTMRFRREIASELGVSRQHIAGLCLGKHGLDVVPCWSTVSASPFLPSDVIQKLEELKGKGLERTPRDNDHLRKLARDIRKMCEAHDAMGALSNINSHPAEVRALLRRYASYFGVPLYPRMAVGEKVCKLMQDLVEGREILFAAQVHITGDEFLGIKGQAIGAPVAVSSRGVRVVPITLDPREEEAVRLSAQEAKQLSQSVLLIQNMRKRRSSGGSLDQPSLMKE